MPEPTNSEWGEPGEPLHRVRGSKVRAVVYEQYGPPGVLRVEELPIPSPDAKQVLVRGAAPSVNLTDWECLSGSPL